MKSIPETRSDLESEGDGSEVRWWHLGSGSIDVREVSLSLEQSLDYHSVLEMQWEL
jgi:hypothetical protein